MTPNDDKDEEDVLNGCTNVIDNKEDSKLVNTMLICADNHGKDVSWHLNRNKGKAQKNFKIHQFCSTWGSNQSHFTEEKYLRRAHKNR